jgi:hypothetical protein
VGAIIVRPTGFNAVTNRTAYGTDDSAYEHEYLFLLSELDPSIHDFVGFGFIDYVDNTTAFPVFWLINGRPGLDTLQPDGVPWFPNQPYGALAQTHPGEKVLMRFIGTGRQMHPFHPHGNHHQLIARDGRLLSSDGGASADLAVFDYTTNILPGATWDALWTWTGEKLGWDIYGDDAQGGFDHTCVDLVDNETGVGPPDGFADPDEETAWEWCADHEIPLPVTLPGIQDLTFGGLYTGNAFLGSFGTLPPGEGGLNLNGGLTFIWHSHNEKELINNDVFPGGMLTFVVIEPPGVDIP